jgi:PHD/YefM family antitoxin component YafN of YafNO toxin-antitoxin module
MLVISSREFRQNQRKYFDMVDEGKQVIVQRGKDKSYVLTAVSEDDMYFNAEMVDKIKESLAQANNGEVVEVNTAEEIKGLLGLGYPDSL